MPIYQYKCSDCGHDMEALQRMSDPRLLDCPECNEPSLVKQLTAAAFKLNGTGWYETDFKNAGAKKSDGTTSAKASSETATKDDGSSSAEGSSKAEGSSSSSGGASATSVSAA